MKQSDIPGLCMLGQSPVSFKGAVIEWIEPVFVAVGSSLYQCC
ncbi:MAG: hypothetical protein ACLROW_19945 [Roseburia faecis]|nr:hypothetical protein [Roseburia faecis]